LILMVRMIAALAAAASMTRPVWNLTPRRNTNVHTVPALFDLYDLASSGSTFLVCALYLVSVSYMLLIARISFE